jgi:hypothetical protein
MQHVKHLVDLAAILSPVLSLAVGLLTIQVLRSQVRLSREISRSSEELTRQLKRADIVQGFNTRYDRLWEVRHNPELVADAKTFHLRFWSLQLDQYIQWKDGFVPDADFSTWMSQRRGDFSRDSEFNQVSFSDGWRHAQSEMAASATFTTLIEDVRNGQLSIEEALNKARLGSR